LLQVSIFKKLRESDGWYHSELLLQMLLLWVDHSKCLFTAIAISQMAVSGGKPSATIISLSLSLSLFLSLSTSLHEQEHSLTSKTLLHCANKVGPLVHKVLPKIFGLI
jgi:hypothetical protein